MSQGDEVEQHETGSFEHTEACECYPPEFQNIDIEYTYNIKHVKYKIITNCNINYIN